MNRKVVSSLILLIALPLYAVGPDSPRATSVGGVVDRVEGSRLIIAEGVAEVDIADAIITGPHLTEMEAADIRPGDRVIAMLDDAALPLFRATHVVVMRPPLLDVSGRISAVDSAAQTIIIAGLTIRLTDETQYSRPPFAEQPVVLQPGDWVHVGVHRSGGELVAARVVMLSPPVPTPPQFPRGGNTVLEGTLSARDGHIWTIAGLRVAVTPRTRVTGNPQIGDRVRVSGIQGRDEILALTVKKL